METTTASVAQYIQTGLTPVFLLSGIGLLLGLFNTRLAHIVDQMAHAADLLNGTMADEADEARLRRHLARYGQRIFLLDTAIAISAIGGASTCGTAFLLFLGSVRQWAVGDWTINLFTVALACTVGSLVVFLGDSVLAWHGLRSEGPLPRSLRGGRK